VGDVGKSGEKSEKDEDESTMIIVPNSSWVTRIGRFFEDVDEDVEGGGVHGNLLVRWGEGNQNTVQHLYYVTKPPCG